MVANVSFNPIQTTNASGTFNIESTGYIQGTALDSPAIRNSLAGGVLASTETLPMWGGVGISENVPSPGSLALPNSVLGGPCGRATSLTPNTAGALTGFSVFDQNHSAINTPQSPVPLVGSGMTFNFYRLGTGARIAVAIDPALVSLEGGIITQLVSWDFNQQRLVPYQAAEPANTITSMSWANTNGGTVSATTAAAHGLVVGDDVTIAGVIPTAYNGDYAVASVGSTTTFTYLLPLASTPGAVTTQGAVAAGGGALSVSVLDIQIGNSMTVVYNTTTGFATWNRTGSTAIIQI